MAKEDYIPDDWKESVVRILREGDDRNVLWTKQAFLDWRAATLSQFRYEAYDAIAEALAEAKICGKKVNLPEDGETYAFFFRYAERILYAKICLRSSKVSIKIISTHTPRKGDQLF